MRLAPASLLGFLLLAALAPAPRAEQVDECGVVYAEAGCLRFRPFALPFRVYGLGSSSPVDEQIVRLVGGTVACPAGCGSYPANHCLSQYSILECPQEDLGCGIRRGYPNPATPCCVWDSFRYGQVVLGEWDCQFADGDTVHVTGHLDSTSSFPVCLMGPPSLRDGTLAACVDTATAAVQRSWGSIKAHCR
jgi:hypothetical protein